MNEDVGSPAAAATKATVRKKTVTGAKTERISETLIKTVIQRLEEGKRVRRTLPHGGRLHIDRQLPFLCIYRRPPQGTDEGTAELVMGEASYIIASGHDRHQAQLKRLVTGIVGMLRQAFGSCLLLELWAGPDEGASGKAQEAGAPQFRILLPRKQSLQRTVEVFEQALQSEQLSEESIQVETATVMRPCPPGFTSIIQPAEAVKQGIHLMGLEVNPVYRDADGGKFFPMVHQALRRRIAHAYKRGFYDFTRRNTTHRPPHYHALGPRAMVKAVWAVDRSLAEVSAKYDFLLALTPINTEAAWNDFRRARFEAEPGFRYRPIAVDPGLLKRQLFHAPLERIEDPTLADLFRTQQLEIERKLSLLADRNTPLFVFGSLQLFGPIGPNLVQSAHNILEHMPPGRREDGIHGYLDAEAFAARARDELDYLRLTHPEVTSRVLVRRDVTGLIVSRGNLLVGRSTRVPAARVNAALAHEVGTHIVTYINGRAQPFRQLYVGLPGYEELQEGLAVLAEYLVGGLTRPRLRLLAARVVAARSMVDGASFVEVFRALERNHGFTQRTAFTIAMRVFRGGGLTKDAVYLRGLLQLMEYLRGGGQLEPLLAGKYALQHVPIVEELRLRRVLGPPPLRPSYLDDPGIHERLERVRAGLSLPDLITRRKS